MLFNLISDQTEEGHELGCGDGEKGPNANVLAVKYLLQIKIATEMKTKILVEKGEENILAFLTVEDVI